MKSFKKDDMIKCVKETPGLKVGRLYTLTEKVSESDVGYCLVCGDAHGSDVRIDDLKEGLVECRFKKATEREEILYRLHNDKDIALEIKKEDKKLK